MSKQKYKIHEKFYKEYLENGNDGWGPSSRFNDWKIQVDRLAQLDHFPKSGNLLELGCGAGNVALMFAEKGYDVEGIDISETAINWAKQRFEKSGYQGGFVKGNVVDLSLFSDRRFDVVIDGNCLHCILGGDRKTILDGVYRVLKPNGVFFVSTLSGSPREAWFQEGYNETYDAHSRTLYREGVPYRHFAEKKSILEELSLSGFKVIESIESSSDFSDHLKILCSKTCRTEAA